MTIKLPEMTHRIAVLPRDERGYPVPWFVAWKDGKPIFQAMDRSKWRRAVKLKLCWVCGQSLSKTFAFVIGPMCGINRTSAEPPCHIDCAMFSVRACPFLALPKKKRIDCSDLGLVDAPGVGLDRNPGCCGVWVTDRYELFDAGNGQLIHLGEPKIVHWFAEGRPATSAEVLESIRTGLPALQAMAAEEGPDAEAELIRLTDVMKQYLPKNLAAGF